MAIRNKQTGVVVGRPDEQPKLSPGEYYARAVYPSSGYVSPFTTNVPGKVSAAYPGAGTRPLPANVPRPDLGIAVGRPNVYAGVMQGDNDALQAAVARHQAGFARPGIRRQRQAELGLPVEAAPTRTKRPRNAHEAQVQAAQLAADAQVRAAEVAGAADIAGREVTAGGARDVAVIQTEAEKAIWDARNATELDAAMTAAGVDKYVADTDFATGTFDRASAKDLAELEAATKRYVAETAAGAQTTPAQKGVIEDIEGIHSGIARYTAILAKEMAKPEGVRNEAVIDMMLELREADMKRIRIAHEKLRAGDSGGADGAGAEEVVSKESGPVAFLVDTESSTDLAQQKKAADIYEELVKEYGQKAVDAAIKAEKVGRNAE